MAADKNSALILALSPKGKSSDSMASDDDDDMEKTAASDIMDAIKSNDRGALQGALKRFVSSCMTSYDKDPEEEAKEA